MIQTTDMMSRILIAVDGSEHADKVFEFAAHLAKKTGAKLLILHVFEELGNIGYSITKKIELNNIKMLERYKTRAKKELAHTNVDVIESRANDAAEEILNIAKKENIDTIDMYWVVEGLVKLGSLYLGVSLIRSVIPLIVL